MLEQHNINKLGQIDSELVRVTYEIPIPAILVNLVTALITALIFIQDIPTGKLITWYLLIVLSVVMRITTVVIYRKSSPEQPFDAYWSYLIITIMSLSALAWGSSAYFLFVPGSYEKQMILAAFVSVTSIAICMNLAYKPVILAFQLFSIVPIIIMLIAQGSSRHYLTAGIMAIMIVAIIASLSRHLRALSEMIRLRYELAKEKYTAEQANLAKSRFLAAASHDLRQPLHALAIFSGVLNGRIKEEKDRNLLDQIQNSASALENLLNALLDISKLDSGAVAPQKKGFRLNTLLSRMNSEYTLQANEKNLTLVVDSCDLAVYSDPVLLETIIRNLLSNAIRYTQSGSVRLTTIEDNGSVWIEVIDTGCGIAEDSQELIFEEFTQLHNVQRDRSKGLGLGLSIVRRLANLLGHTLELHSSIDNGTVVRIKVAISADISPETQKIDTADDTLHQHDGVCILVIDDEREILEATHSLMEQWGVKVITAQDVNGAIAAIKAHREKPDAILTDLRLNENETGLDAIEAIHNHLEAKIPAMVITGDINAESLDAVRAAGLPMLHKPVSAARFRAFVNQIALTKDRPNVMHDNDTLLP
ncbi:MAG: ATP-binding protein [Chromatiales bacterium]|nr:ATP-binding protein [Chromatiales bacterium]